jgi:hypothetical protein
MVEAGNYLLSNVGFSKEEKPYLSLQKDTTFETLLPLNKTITLKIDTSTRFCIGWGDITTGERFVCPDTTQVDTKYEQCPPCQKRTGFNPAFYHASSVSEQQEARNLQPHILYLAYFSPDTIKVGISLAARGHSRLLEQGARSAIILEIFSSAHIARQYEAKIASLPGFAETVLLRKKLSVLDAPYTEARAATLLTDAKSKAEAALGISFPKAITKHFNARFFPSTMPDLTDTFDCSEKHFISGDAIGMLGSLFFCKQQDQDTLLFLPLKKLIGYQLALSYDEVKIDLPARQASLF